MLGVSGHDHMIAKQSREEIAMSTDSFRSGQTAHTGLEGMNRRHFLVGAAAVASLAASGAAVGAAGPVHDHASHAPQRPALLAAVNDCVAKGQSCIAHCLVTFKEGDISLADCAAKVHEMDAVCKAFSYLLAANSTYLLDYASICTEVCQDCEDECRKHDQHIECKACADACAEVIAQIKKAFA
jgi:Cys-rich four helix bundle protein (predicted Tat secretion target)